MTELIEKQVLIILYMTSCGLCSGMIIDTFRLFQKRFFEENNGGRPMKNICNLVDGNEKVVNSFLSFRIEKRNLSEANGFDFRRQKSPSSV